MGSNLKFQNLHLLNGQVIKFPQNPTFSKFNFISSSRTRIVLQFRTSIYTLLPFNKLHYFSLSSLSSPAPVALFENSSNEHSFEVSYLINTFGWSPELAFSKAKYLKFNTSEKPDNVVAVLKKHGFTETQISSIVKKNPRVILSNPQKTLLPKLEFLSSIGLSAAGISSVITAYPQILNRSLKKMVIPTYNLLCNLLGSDDKVVELIEQYPVVLNHDPDIENTQILLEAGVPKVNIVHSMKFQRRGYSHKPSADTFRMTVEKVKEMGFDPSSNMFISAIRSIRYMSKSTWERKVQVLKKYGWSDREILLAFEKNPKFIMASKEKIVGVMDFLVNIIGVEATALANWPVIFCLSLEKRIVPRCLLYQAMLEQGLSKRKKKLSLLTLLNLTDTQFISRFIKAREKEAPELLGLYQKMLDI